MKLILHGVVPDGPISRAQFLQSEASVYSCFLWAVRVVCAANAPRALVFFDERPERLKLKEIELQSSEL